MLEKLFILPIIIYQLGNVTGFSSERSPMDLLNPTDYEITHGLAVQYRPGDIILGALVGQHEESEVSGRCGKITSFGVQMVEVINMIIDEVNNSSKNLPGIKLGTLMMDSCLSETHSVQMVINHAFPLFWKSHSHCEENLTKSDGSQIFAGIIGAATSGITITISKILQSFQIPLVSYWATNPVLSDKMDYPNVFRTVPSDTHQVQAMIDLITSKGWSYISVLYLDNSYGVHGFREIERQVGLRNICISYSKSIPRKATSVDFENEIKTLITSHSYARVVILFLTSQQAEELFKAATSSNLARGYFLWIGSDAWSNLLPVNRNDNMIEDELKNSIGFLPKSKPIKQLTTHLKDIRFSDRTGENKYKNLWFAQHFGVKMGCNVEESPYNNFNQTYCSPSDRFIDENIDQFPFMQYIADAAYSFVHALDDYHKQVCHGKPGICQDLLCSAGTNHLAQQLVPYLQNVSFSAANGNEFHFDDNHDGPAQYSIEIYKGLSNLNNGWVTIGEYHHNALTIFNPHWNNLSDNLTSVCSPPCSIGQAKIVQAQMCCWTCLPCSTNQIVSENGRHCVDCDVLTTPNVFRNTCQPVEIRNVSPTSLGGIASASISIFSLLLSVVVSTIYVRHRSTAIVKASSRELTCILFLGVILSDLNGLEIMFGHSFLTCAISKIFFCLGPCLIYASLLAKTIRVVIIFNSKKMKSYTRAYIRPTFQLLTAALLVVVQVFFLVVWFLLYPNNVIVTGSEREGYHFDCSGSEGVKVLMGLVYPFLLIAICTALSTAHRNIPDAFNEAKYIGFTMYTTCIIWLAYLSIYLSNPDNVMIKVFTTNICLSLNSIAAVSCLYLPRCFTILWRPERNTRQSVMTTAFSRSASQNQRKIAAEAVKRSTKIATLSDRIFD